MLKLYNELATWWPLLSPPEEYLDEAEFFWQVFRDEQLPSSPSLLELGCGGGSNAFHLKKHFAHMTLTDQSPAMLAVSRSINPECEHLQGDMRTLRLGRLFDVVFVHDAIEYMTTLEELRQVMETAYLHCERGGIALFVPDHVRETYQPSTDHGGHDGEGRALRYLEWAYDPDESDNTHVVEFTCVLREGKGPAWVEHERHVHGLFSRREWLRLLSGVGYQPAIVHDQDERETFLARKR